jgi:hypothetical protein
MNNYEKPVNNSGSEILCLNNIPYLAILRKEKKQVKIQK